MLLYLAIISQIRFLLTISVEYAQFASHQRLYYFYTFVHIQ